MKLRAFAVACIAFAGAVISTGAKAFDCTDAVALPHNGGLVYVRACVQKTLQVGRCILEFQGYVTEKADSTSRRIPVERIDLFYEIPSANIKNGQTCTATEICSRTESNTGGCPTICAATATINQGVRIGTAQICR